MVINNLIINSQAKKLHKKIKTSNSILYNILIKDDFLDLKIMKLFLE